MKKMRIWGVTVIRQNIPPAFHAYRNAETIQAMLILFENQVVYNQGSHYNSSNGRFTPVDGVYQFNVLGSITGFQQMVLS